MAQTLTHLLAMLAALFPVICAFAIRRTGGSILARLRIRLCGVRRRGLGRLREGSGICGEPRNDQGLKQARYFHADLHKVAADYGTAAGRCAWRQRLYLPSSRPLHPAFANLKLKHWRGVRSKTSPTSSPLLEFRIHPQGVNENAETHSNATQIAAPLLDFPSSGATFDPPNTPHPAHTPLPRP